MNLPSIWGPTRNAGSHLDTALLYFEDFIDFTIEPTIVDLTDSSAGTGNDTIQALTDPGDTPATVDALRDDLVANLIPELRNNYADLAAKVSEIVIAYPCTFGTAANSQWKADFTGNGGTERISDRCSKLSDIDGGAVRITNGVQNTNRTNFQFANATFPGLWQDRKLIFETRFRLSAVDMNIFMGICPVSFNAAATSYNLDLLDEYMGFGCEESSALTVGAGAENVVPRDTGKVLVADTWHKMTCVWDGKSQVKFHFDNEHVATIANVSVPGDLLVSPCISLDANGTGSETMDIDYIAVMAERV